VWKMIKLKIKLKFHRNREMFLLMHLKFKCMYVAYTYISEKIIG